MRGAARLPAALTFAALLALAVSPVAFADPDTAPDAAPSVTAAPPPSAPPVVQVPAVAPSGITVTAPPSAPPAPPPVAAAPPPPVETAGPVVIDHPEIPDSATLAANGQRIALFGITGQDGDAAKGLQEYVRAEGDRLTCLPHGGNGQFSCVLPDNTDLALVAIANGAARASADAPEPYRLEQKEAQAARRGIWANLPPPPITLSNPVVRTTSVMVAGNQTYMIDGIDGIAGKPAQDLQNYVNANHASLLCQPQGSPGHYLCTLPDGTDIAKLALVNGAARVASDAPDAYRIEQGDAIANRRGIWSNASAAALAVAPPPSGTVALPVYGMVQGEPSDGIAYVGAQPTAVIGGETVFLVYGGGLGWGYYDRYHAWHGAPENYAYHMNHYHPDGYGLRTYGSAGYHGSGEWHGGGANEWPGNGGNAAFHGNEFHGNEFHGGNAAPHGGGNNGFVHPTQVATGHPGAPGGGHPAPSAPPPPKHK